MTAPPSSFDQLCQFLDDPQTGWSLGTFGAIAEFSREPPENAPLMRDQNTVGIVTLRGAIRIKRHPATRILPYEILSKLPNAWSQGVMICLPLSDAAMTGNTLITDIGTDDDALSVNDGARFFDLGLGVSHVDFCIRTDDPALVCILEKHSGTAFSDVGETVINAIREACPVRIFRSQLGRIEVYQPIPSDSADDHTPVGPHTHVIAELLAHGRTHAANVPVPDGWLPCLAAFPPNPIRTGDGDLQSFDQEAFDRFQTLINKFSPPELSGIKQHVFDAITTGKMPDAVAPPTTRAERTALRVALRQCHHLHGPSDILKRWKVAYEPTGRQ